MIPPPPEGVHILLPRTYEQVKLCGKGIKNAGGMKVASRLTLRCRDYPGLATWAQCNHKDAYKWKRKAEEREPADSCMGRFWHKVAGFEDGGRGHEPRKAGSLSQKRQGVDASLDPPGGTQP